MIDGEIILLLEQKYEEYNQPSFIALDPVQIPHQFADKKNIEIVGFLAATLAWGQRKTMINSLQRLMNLLDFQPYDFIRDAGRSEVKRFGNFKHRTFNGKDCSAFILALQRILREYNSLGAAFCEAYEKGQGVKEMLSEFRDIFMGTDFPYRTQKHLANVKKGSAAKRLNMFLRWMVRKDGRGVDFGLWDFIHPQELYLPLDLHTGNVARKLGLLGRKQNDWKAVEEVTENLRILDPKDPVKYDFALFGLGIYDGF